MVDFKDGIDIIRSEFLALAFAGSLIAQSFWPPTGRAKVAINIAIGTVISCASSPLIVALASWKFPTLPAEAIAPLQAATYFWFGLLGMQAVPLAIKVIKKITPGAGE